jgi:4-amino-4-deoxy-L-arabinose transferase-like glycosyltransferase
VSQFFDSYDACNHVLHTILCKLSISLLGLSEFTLRIPSLLGGLLYMFTIYRLSRHLFGEGPLLLLSVALLSLNPLVMDFMSAARGYGPALALFLWALYQMLLHVDDPGHPRVFHAAIGLALSVAANLTLLAPATALACAFLAVLIADPVLGGAHSAGRRFSLALDRFVVPGVVTAFVIVILPLSKAHRADFYVGHDSLSASAASLFGLSMYLAPVALAAVAVACGLALSQWARARNFAALARPRRFMLLGGSALVGAIAILIAANHAAGLLYPHGRTGLYLIPLFLLTALALPGTCRPARVAVWVVGLVCLAQFAVQFRTSYYGEWRYDASTKKTVSLIRERQASQPLARVRVGASVVLVPGLNFYRRMYRLNWMEPVDRTGPNGDFDFYMLLGNDQALVKRRGLSVLYTDNLSGAWLAHARISP